MSDKELMEDIESVEEMVVDPDPEEEEAHDESEAEADEEVSEAAAAPEVDGAKAAEDDAAKIKKSAPSQAKVPGGAATKGDPIPSTKAGMINAMYGKMNAMKKSDLMASYHKMMNAMAHPDKEDDDMDEMDHGKKKKMEMAHGKKKKMESVEVDFSADLGALVESEATLSEGFRDKAAVIFEAAIKSKLSEEVARIESELQEEFDEELKTTREEMVEQIDGYLNYVVEKFMEENKLAIEHGLRTELAEDFMNGLKNLFTESYVEVPESKVDLVDELGTQVRELEEKLNETTEASIRMTGELEELKRDAIIREHSRDLAETQVEKLKSLAEDIDFEDAETFASKVATIKESYFTKKKVTVVEESVDEAAEEQEVTGSMAMYVNALKQTHKPQ
jgi:AraC-like DNA-binding protein